MAALEAVTATADPARSVSDEVLLPWEIPLPPSAAAPRPTTMRRGYAGKLWNPASLSPFPPSPPPRPPTAQKAQQPARADAGGTVRKENLGLQTAGTPRNGQVKKRQQQKRPPRREQAKGSLAAAHLVAEAAAAVQPPTSPDAGASRRSQRQRFRPLQYWRGERVVYGQSDGTEAAPFERVVDVLVAVDDDL